MVLRTVAGVVMSEDAEDLRTFLGALRPSAGGETAPKVDETVVLACGRHEDDRPTWGYVEADARAGVARRRCLQCAQNVHVLDSEQRWTHPPMWSCPSCQQSIAEVAAGLSVADGEHVTWVVLAARCVECGRVAGLTDMVLPGTPLTEVLEAL
jgi:hypothetical protein